ncbi:type VII secretion protein EccB [Protaetiibacter intestinalis]|uniref:Type VII secretion protein EccB n=1 Tax=Protaetiibacter intestinalis TaxID=2419774 RepID=A0A387B979_9MICO|nr:type VII secretion protein EccB [Protaetiibacter intestinalis]AYF97735.1 type VII secretion protein EccB [Protaetiibacter intestinalis]
MATKKDLQEAVGFSRRRLLTAFTSGAPGGKELEPAKPLRAVIAGIGIAAAVVVAGLFYGFLRPGLPEGWQQNSLIVLKDTGGRFVAVDGTLYPVINTASARLLIESSEFRLVMTDQATISGVPVGPTIGIVGAPDDLPAVGSLQGDGWTACPAPDGTAVGIAASPLAEASDGGVVVELNDEDYVVAGDRRFAVPASARDAVLRAVGLDEARPLPVDGRWLNLFAPGDELAPLDVPDAGDEVPGTSLIVGQVVHPDGTPDDRRFLVTSDGRLAPLGELAYQLYLLGAGAVLGPAVSVSPAQLAALPTADAPAGGDWPSGTLAPLEGTACALLQHDDTGDPTTVLAAAAAAPAVALDADGVRLQPSTGALVRGGGVGSDSQGVVTIVDATGTAFPVPGADEEVLARLGYLPEHVSRVTDRWLQFLPSGPELTVAAAGSTPDTGERVVEPPSDEPTPSALAVDGRTAAADECTPGVVAFQAGTPTPLTQLQLSAASALATGQGVLVAVVDSGIDAANPQLAGAVVGGVDLVGDGTDPHGFTDVKGHGTAVAGIIAARPVEGSGIVGVAPQAELLSVRVFRGDDDRSVEAGFGPDTAKVTAGIRWAVAHGADVINLSLSQPVDDPELAAAVREAVAAGVVLVASGGNRDTAVVTTDGLRYPAAYPDVLGVAAAGLDGRVTETSIHGPQVDVSAPGADVWSTAPGAGNCQFTNATDPSSSYATGYATGAVALLRERFPEETPAQLEYRLMVSAARADPDTRDDRDGWGFIQPFEALTVLPDAGLRGPAAPEGVGAPALTPAGVELAPDAGVPPIRITRELAIGIASLSLVVVGAIVVIALGRRRPEPQPPPRTGGGLFPSTTPDPEA